MIDFLHRLADASGAAILGHYRRLDIVDNKLGDGAFDPVTAGDRAAEQAIRSLLAEYYPDHGIIGEEYGRHNENARFVWVIDPIDGTRAFMSGMPTWGTLIALLEDGKPIFGMIDQPYLRERFWGDGAAAWRRIAGDTAPIRTRPTHEPREAIVWVGSSFAENRALHGWVEQLRGHVRLLRYGADCYSHAALACGHIDAVLASGLDIYDIAAHVPLITGAGGIVKSLDGRAVLDAGAILCAGSAQLADALTGHVGAL